MEKTNAWIGMKTKSVTLLILNMQEDDYRMGELMVIGNECCEEVGSTGKFIYYNSVSILRM